jgi:uncharacterized alkaline shock family protein YloU
MSTSQTASPPREKEREATLATGNTATEALQTEGGTTTIGDGVVEKVADMAAREVRGVHDLAGGMGGALRRLTPGLSDRGSGTSVEVGKKETIIDLDLIVDYGVSIPQLAQAVRENVIDRVNFITGLDVKEVNLEINDLFFVEEERRRQAERDRADASRVQ